MGKGQADDQDTLHDIMSHRHPRRGLIGCNIRHARRFDQVFRNKGPDSRSSFWMLNTPNVAQYNFSPLWKAASTARSNHASTYLDDDCLVMPPPSEATRSSIQKPASRRWRRYSGVKVVSRRRPGRVPRVRGISKEITENFGVCNRSSGRTFLGPRCGHQLTRALRTNLTQPRRV